MIDLGALHARAAALDPAAVFAMLALLPLLGVPASPLYLLAGARFGSAGGMAVAAGSIAINLAASHWIGTVLRGPLLKLLARFDLEVPRLADNRQSSVAILAALAPGIPYTAKLYLLPLGGMALRPFFWGGLPAHVLHASVGVLLGGLAEELTPPKIALLLAYAATVALLCRHALRRWKAAASAAAPPPA